MVNRRYSESEVSAILSRAADLTVTDPAGGTSLDELERIGEEAGLSSELVRRAAAELARGAAPAQASSFWQRAFGRVRARFETVLPGEVGEDAHEELFDIVQERLGLPGTLNRAGRAFSWSLNPGASGGRNMTLHVSSRNGQTTVRVEERFGNLAGGIWGGLFGGLGGSLAPFAGIGAAALGGGPIGVGLAVLGTLAATAGGTRVVYESAQQKREAQMSALFEAMTDCVARYAVVDDPAENQAEVQAHTADATSALEEARNRHGLRDAPPRVLASEALKHPPEAADEKVPAEVAVTSKTNAS